MEKTMIRGYTVKRGQPWSKAMERQDHNCARCGGRISTSISPAQKKRWLVEDVGYCGTCAIIVRRKK